MATSSHVCRTSVVHVFPVPPVSSRVCLITSQNLKTQGNLGYAKPLDFREAEMEKKTRPISAVSPSICAFTADGCEAAQEVFRDVLAYCQPRSSGDPIDKKMADCAHTADSCDGDQTWRLCAWTYPIGLIVRGVEHSPW